MTQSAKTILITGASGYLGRLIAAILLDREDVDIVLPVRSGHESEAVKQAVGYEFEAWGQAFTAAVASRVEVVQLPPFERLSDLDVIVERRGVDEVVHAAGCLDYFDGEASRLVNVEFTRSLLERSKVWGVRRFVYISTAFSSGYVDGVVSERLHDGASSSDPTVYTRTKREAERLVANAGLPYLILRPSIIVGDSRDGHYTGKQYGLYQLWAGIERLLCTAWEPEFHIVAPLVPLNLVHQDAFQLTFLEAWRSLPSQSVMNIVADDRHSPNPRELWNLMLERYFKPDRIFYYDTVDALPVGKMARRQRALMALGSVNIEIGAHAWRFERSTLDALVASGLRFPHATVESVGRCQEVFVAGSERIQKFMRNRERYRAQHLASLGHLLIEPRGAEESVS